MTKVLYEPKGFHIRIEGHAGSAPKGEDLVCAGISALGFALVKAVDKEHYKEQVEFDTTAAVIDVKCKPASAWYRIQCEIAMDAIAGGLELIADQYPEYATFERSE